MLVEIRTGAVARVLVAGLDEDDRIIYGARLSDNDGNSRVEGYECGACAGTIAYRNVIVSSREQLLKLLKHVARKRTD